MTNIHNHKIPWSSTSVLNIPNWSRVVCVKRGVRELWAGCNWRTIREFNPDGIILSGGPESTTEENSPRAPEYVFNAGVPVLGICYGMQNHGDATLAV